MLKRELTELGRTVQRRGDIVYHLQEILERDEKRVEDIDRNTIKKTKMLVQNDPLPMNPRSPRETLIYPGKDNILIVIVNVIV